MTIDWSPQETSTHQDHVIAHVIGATVLGYFSTDQALHILLDISFIWTIYVDGEMGLLQQSLAIRELPVDDETRARLREDVRLLQEDGRAALGLAQFTAAPVDCLITAVSFFAHGDDERRILLEGEEAGLVIETSLVTGAVRVRVA
ncbi:MAG TPA: hypothetical protein VGX92_09215 [Pyrinomonadaceae bacterium]|jgi:hypothetical protein|nr:hypothetical protein [Pyrinomonadaceae bacterium]